MEKDRKKTGRTSFMHKEGGQKTGKTIGPEENKRDFFAPQHKCA